MYIAILFDLDDTLFSLRGCEAEALQRTLAGAGLLARLPENFVERYAAISARYWAARTADGFTRYSRDDVLQLSWRDFLTNYGLDGGQSAELAARFWIEFCRSSALNQGAETVLQGLSEAYRLGMITNGYSDSQRGRLESAGLKDVFDPLLISEEVGVAKPDIRIFELALAQLGLPPEAVLYVGDSISHDHEGCLRAGIDFCHYCPGHCASAELPDARYRVAALGDLIPLLLPGFTP